MKSKIIVLLFGCLFSLSVFAQQSSITAAFVDVGIGARPTAMGGAFTGLANDVDALFFNPAGLADIKEKQATFNFAKIYGLVKYNMASYGMPLNFDGARQGGGIAVISSGDEALTELTVLVGYGRVTGPVTVGMNLKYRRASFGNNTLNLSDYQVFDPAEFNTGVLNQVTGKANGFGFDLGVMYQLHEKIKIGMMLRDVFSPVSWDSKVENPDAKAKGKYTENVPMEAMIGTSYVINEDMVVTADYQPSFAKDVFNRIRGGAEVRFFKFLNVRAGLQNTVNDIDDEKFMFGAGFGFKVKGYRISFDYTSVMETLANSNRITIGLVF
ncbi:MAG: hypothetical protein HYV28_05785 [Ignavibacteriales bacterium]|nr:hypothetical protein [Ignavibacteriales bacterium]